MPATDRVRETVDALYVSDSRRVLATLIRLLGDFDAAEEALHDAFRAALEHVSRLARDWFVPHLVPYFVEGPRGGNEDGQA